MSIHNTSATYEVEYVKGGTILKLLVYNTLASFRGQVVLLVFKACEKRGYSISQYIQFPFKSHRNLVLYIVFMVQITWLTFFTRIFFTADGFLAFLAE